MSEDFSQTLRSLRLICVLDGKLAGIRAERKRLEDELATKRSAINAAKNVAAERINAFTEKNDSYRREERFLKDEQAKLVDRRKALQSLQNYKLQQAAEREIEAASKQLGAQEETLIMLLDQVEELNTAAEEAKSVLSGLESELEALQKEADEAFIIYEQRASEHTKNREELTASVSKTSLTAYERVADRYPMDAVVALTNNTCSGCFMALGPQSMVEISRAKNIVRCRGCGRILFLESREEESGG